MVPDQLTQRQTRQPASLAAAAVFGLTALGTGLALFDPALAGTTRPHPTLTGSLGDAASILQNNARLLAAPFLLAGLGFQRTPLGRRGGDAIMLALSAASTITVGLELGRWRERLLPYIPQLPIEWAALAVSLTAWLLIRTGQPQRTQITRLAILAAALAIVAASIETWCTPHRHITASVSDSQADTAREPHTLVGTGGCLRPGFCAAPGRTASRSRAPFPSRSSVPLGLISGADRAYSNHRPPQGGIT